MRIGELASRTGVNIETIRYYERAGILNAPPRAANNYRCYDEGHRRRLGFVRRARELGFTLDEIRTLLSMIDAGDYTCAEVKSLGERHREEIRRRITDLERMERAMAAILSGCQGGQTPDCSMLESLFDEAQ